MEKIINNKLPQHISLFFDELSNYLNTPLFFFGSIQRNDYFPENSDIDIAIFTDNQSSLISKMQQYLLLKKNKFKNIIWRLNNIVVFGHKVMFKNIEKKFSVEFSIYDNKYKNHILEEHKYKILIPFYISWLLIILKIIYYNLGLLPYKTFKYLKRKILSDFIGKPNDENDFLVISSSKINITPKPTKL